MTPEELQARIGANAPIVPPRAPSPVVHVSQALGCSDEHAAVFARAKGLIDEHDTLHCARCKEPTDWHVSLHCPRCRVEGLHRAAERDRLDRLAWAKRQAERSQEQQQRPQQVAGRSFRDGY